MDNNAQKPKCVICGKPIPANRIKALEILGVPREQWTTIDCAPNAKKKGIYLGESGTSELLLVREVYTYTVRDMFRDKPNLCTEEEDDEKD